MGKHEKGGDVPDAGRSAELRPFGLKAVVFLCGAGLMGLEMAGVRLLEPHFGSTIFVWGSIIGIFLGALSLGYWTGGLLADRLPRAAVLGCVILLAAGLVFAVPPAASPLCRYLAGVEGMDPRVRALLGSLILYALPSICLGMVSPFAVRLAAREVSGVGSVAGGLYAFSTLGSLAGTFLVSFVLVEVLGSKAIVWGIGCELALVAAFCILSSRARGKAHGLLAGLGLLLVLPGWLGLRRARAADRLDAAQVMNRGQPPDVKPGECVFTGESAYHRVGVIRAYYNIATDAAARPNRRIHYLLFNNQIESGGVLDERDPDAPAVSACGYTRMLHLGVLLTGRKPRRVLIIGCGGGIGPQAFKHDYAGTVERIDVVDVDPLVFRLAHRYFRYPLHDAVIRSHVQDGRLFLAGSRQKWDYVVLDAYTAGGRIPRHLITREFFQEVKRHLAPGGIALANVISATAAPEDPAARDTSRLFRAVYKTMDAVFGAEGHVYTFPRRRAGSRGENIILVATTTGGVLDSVTLLSRYGALAGRLIKQPNLERIVRDVMVTPPPTGDVPLLTDDFCPTDSMVLW